MHNRFKEVRKAAGLALRPFGDLIGIGATSVQRIELGVNNPSEQTIRAVCQQFNVNRHWLETGEGEMYEPAPVDLIAQLAAEHNLGPGGQALLRVALRIFDELGPDALERVITDTIPAIMAERNIESPAEAAARKSSPRASDEEAN